MQFAQVLGMNAARNPLNVCPYWVGDILTTMSKIQPAQRWPGTSWVQITDCMLRAADESHPAGSTGGAWELAQTIEQMPPHSHPQAQQANNGGIAVCVTDPGITPGTQAGLPFHSTEWSGGSSQAISTYTTGSGKPMPIVNKYTACYMWQRTG